jgi:peroxiredoxin
MTVLAVNWKESQSNVQNYVKQMGLNFPVLLDPNGALISQFKANYHPHSVFINREGVIVGVVAGGVTPAKMDEMLKKMLE